MKEFIKISLHNHFGDRDSELVLEDDIEKTIRMNFSEAIRRIEDAKENYYELLAITNSNSFKLSDYILLRIFSNKLGIELLPGLEFNLQNPSDKTKYHHFVIIFNPSSNLYQIENLIRKYIKENEKAYLDLDQLVDIAILNKCIISIHGIKQDGKSSVDNPETLIKAIELGSVIPVILEDNQEYHKATLKQKLIGVINDKENRWIDEVPCVSAVDRFEFGKEPSPTLLWGNNTFDDLYYACILGKYRFFREKDVSEKTKYISRINIYSDVDAQIKPVELTLSHGLNTIIGSSGSGKTLFLDLINYYITGKHLQNTDTPVDAYEHMNKGINLKIYDNYSNEIKIPNNFKIFEAASLYNKIIKIYSSDKSQLFGELNLSIDDSKFKKFILDMNNKANIYLKNLFELQDINIKLSNCISKFSSNCDFLRANSEKVSSTLIYSLDQELIDESREVMNKINILNSQKDIFNSSIVENINIMVNNYVEPEIIKKFKRISAYVEKKIELNIKSRNMKKLELDRRIIFQEFMYKTILNYNDINSKNSKRILEQQAEAAKTARVIINLMKEKLLIKKNNIIPTLDVNEILSNKFSIESDLVKVNINNVMTKFKKDDLDNIFPNVVGAPRKLLNKSLFTKDFDFSKKEEVEDFFSVLVENNWKTTFSFSDDYKDYFDYSINIVDASGNEEDLATMTAGTLSKIYVEKVMLNEITERGKNLIIIFDQPENNMEKSFLVDNLIKILLDLKMEHQIFITTHEPLLVVNADSNNIIYATNNKTFANFNSNNILYETCNIIKPDSKNDYINKVAKLMDGGISAIEKRSTVYKGVNDVGT